MQDDARGSDPLERGNNFDFLRMALALLVLFSHSFPLGIGSEEVEPIHVITRGQATGGSIAVDLFFVISGFLITASFERSSTVWSFLRKRFARIYPGFIVAILFCLVVAKTIAGAKLMASPWAAVADFASHVARLTEFSYFDAFRSNPFAGAINGSLWSIPYEFWCYIGVAGLGLLGMLRNRPFLLVLFALALVARVAFAAGGWTPGGKVLGLIFGSPRLWARLLALYLAGVVFYVLRKRIPLRPVGMLIALGMLAVAARIPHGWAMFFPLAGSYLLFWAAFHPTFHVHGFARFGDFSYGAYLYAFPVQQCVVALAGRPMRPLVLAAIAAPITLGLAALSWFLVERRFLARSRGTRDRRVSERSTCQVGQAEEGLSGLSQPGPPA